MKIGELAAAAGVSVDTLRYYEKQLLLDPPLREPNGYRSYNAAHLERIKFVRSAQALGFTLAQIVTVIPRLAAGTFGRVQIEWQLDVKMKEIDAQIRTLQALKRDLRSTVAALRCEPGAPMSATAATLPDPGPPARIKRLQGPR